MNDFWQLGRFDKDGQHWRLCHELGTGAVDRTRIRQGIDFFFTHFNCKPGLDLNSTFQAPQFIFYFCLSGGSQTHIAAGKHSLNTRRGGCGLMVGTTGVDCRMALMPDHTYHSFSIIFNPDAFLSLFGGQVSDFPIGLQPIMSKGIQDFSLFPAITTPAMQLALEQIHACPFSGPAARLYLEGKSLELVSHIIHAFKSRTQGFKSLSPFERDQIHHAKAILEKQMENPPGLMALAAEVNLTHTRLNQGFRMVFGTTVFGMLRQIRMARAMFLLRSGRINITQAAMAVGYNNLSHFAKAFRQQFGVNPGSIRQGII